MSDNVIRFTGGTVGHVLPEKVLQGALDVELAGVIVVGKLPNGALYVAGSDHTADSMLLLQRAIADLVEFENYRAS